MKAFSKALLIFLLLLSIPAAAQQTLAPYHPANQYIEYLKLRGYLPALDFTQRPLDRLDIARALLQADSVSAQDRPVYRQAVAEFRAEIQRLSRQKVHRWKRLAQKALQLLGVPAEWSFRQQSMLIAASADAFYTSADKQGTVNLYPQAGVFFGDHVFVYNRFKIFNHAPQGYDGKQFSGLYAYNEQAYLLYRNDWLKAKIGRDWLQIGAARQGQLLFSDNSRPFDQYRLTVAHKGLNFSFWGIQLNRRILSDSLQRRLTPWANRYINGHRLSYSWKNRFTLGVSEVVVYGGPAINWELGYVNPLMMYYAYNVNQKGLAANLFYNIDWDLYFHKLELYGEFLIDDFQAEKKEPRDLEPNELGLTLGLQWADPFNIRGLSVNAEYTQVRNRTYNAPVNDWEKYLHHGEVIGYYLGNNLERYFLSLRYWVNGRLYGRLYGAFLRRGEGSVEDVFNTDYLNYTVEQGYHEPFPFGIVEEQVQGGARVYYHPLNAIRIEAEAAYRQFSNYQNVRGASHSEWLFNLRLWMEWRHLFSLARE